MAGSSTVDNDDFIFEERADPPPSTVFKTREVPSFLPDAARLRVFLAVAALVEAGLDLTRAADLVAEEYEREGSGGEATAIRTFFRAAGNHAVPVDLREVARKSFGATFVGIEETVLLSALPESRDKPATLRAVANLISIKDRASGR